MKKVYCPSMIFLFAFLFYVTNFSFSQLAHPNENNQNCLNCYGTWEYIEGSGVHYELLRDIPEKTYDDSPFLPKKFVIEKGVVLCSSYWSGYNSNGELVQSNNPKYEDGIRDVNGKEYWILKPSGFCSANFTYESNVDIEKKVNSSSRYIGDCSDVHKGGPDNGLFFDCGSGYLVSLKLNQGSREATYYRYKRISENNVQEENKQNYILTLSSNNNNLEPDGKSTSKIHSSLYESNSGKNLPDKPLSNKKLLFIIETQSGVVPGSISSTEGFTDANGSFSLIYTAPAAELIADKNILSASIKVRCEEYNVEETVYINFNISKGDVSVEPNVKGVVSEYGIVPLDNRYPALIKAKIRDANGKLQVNKNVTFTISGSNTYGILKTPDGQSGKSVSTKTDSKGFAEVLYSYSSGNPEGNVMETIEIKADGMSFNEHAYVYLGFNLVAEKVENRYEGKGEINAGEEIPIMITVKDSRYKDLDLQNALSYWGLGGNTGNNRLSLKLDIEPTGSLPGYLMERLQLSVQEQPKFSDEVEIKSVSGYKNALYIKESSLLSYRDLPRIKPIVSGQTNYEVKLSLVDNAGNFVTGNNSNPAIISIKTGLPADATTIFISENPFGPNTPQAVFIRTALDLAGFGTYISVNDAIFAINKGDFVGVVGIMLGELKGKLLDLGKEIPGLTGELIKIYTELATTEKYGSLAFGPGPLQDMEDAVIAKIASTMTRGTSKLVVLKGDGSQSLTDAKGNPIPIMENTFTRDTVLNTISVKHGSVSVYLLPESLDYKYQSASKCREFKKGGNVTKEQGKEKEKTKEKEKSKEKENKKDFFSGKWETSEFGTISFTISGSKVIGACSKNLGGMTGTLSSDGKKVTGTWARFPTYSSPNDAGLFDFTISSDGNSFTGFYSKGTDSKAKLDKSITGKKK